MSETVHNTTKVLLFPKSISRSCLLRDAERDLLVIAKFLMSQYQRVTDGKHATYAYSKLYALA